MSDEQTALIVVPRAELVLAEKKAAAQAERAGRNVWKSIGITLLAGMGAIPLAHIFVPLAIGSALLSVCGIGGEIHYLCKQTDYKNQQVAAKAAQEKERDAIIAAVAEARINALHEAAQSILMRDTGTYAAGQELRIEVANETPKILRIELVGAAVNDEDRPVRKIFARLYETIAHDGSLKRGEPVANIPEIVYATPLNSPLDSSRDSSLAPSSPSGGVEKKLPPCTPV